MLRALQRQARSSALKASYTVLLVCLKVNVLTRSRLSKDIPVNFTCTFMNTYQAMVVVVLRASAARVDPETHLNAIPIHAALWAAPVAG